MLAKRPYMAALLLVVIGLVFGATLVTGFGSWRGVSFAFGASDPALGGALPNLPNDQTLASLNNSMMAIAKAVQPTIVAVEVKTEAPKHASAGNNNPFHHFFGFGDNGDDEGDGGDMPFPFQMPDQGPQEGLGSGVIITSDGYILTNNHVVKDAAKKGGVRVKLTDKRVFDARVVGTDPTTDVAVIKIDATNLPVAALGNSDDCAIGQIVLAIGNPLNLESTVTQGIISSLNRPINIFDPKETKNYGISNFIQTDAAINPGNSGGGLFDIHGAVIGINTAIASNTGMFMGYGFAIPINMAKQIATDLIKTGKVNRGYIGVTIRPVDQTEAEALGLDRPRGVRVDNVQKGGAGADAGLKERDVILSVDGHPVDEANQLQALVAMHHAGDKVQLHVWRDGKELEKTVTLKPRPDVSETASAQEQSDDNSKAQDESATKSTANLDNIGLTVRNLTAAEKDKYEVANGVLITRVAPASEAMDRQLVTNMIVTAVNGRPVKTVSDFEKAVDDQKGHAVGMTVKDNRGDSHWVAVNVPRD